MRKTVTLIIAAVCIMLTAMARDFLIQLKSGKEISIPVSDIAEVRFDASSIDTELPEDPYPLATDFSRKAILFDHTGTRCGNCPLMVLAFQELDNDADYASAYTYVALHSYESDPMGNALIREISASTMTATGWPQASVNFRKSGIGAYERYQMTTDRLKMAIAEDNKSLTPSGIASLANLDDRKLSLTLSMKAGEDGQYRVGAFVVEDGIQAKQTNYYPEITGDAEFDTHNNVVRTVVGRNDDGTFTGIDLGHVRKGETAYTTQEIELGSGWKLENSYLVIYVTEKQGDSYVCVNSAYAPINGEAPFEYDTQNPATDDYIYLPKTFVEADSRGEAITIPFELLGDATEGNVSVTASENWISDLKVNGSNITLTVSDNPNPVSRTARIAVRYGDARPIDITIQQAAAGSEENALFQIETSVLSPYSASVSIVPNGYDGNYLFFVAKASVIDSYIDAGNLQGWIEGDIEYLQEMAEYYGMPLNEFLPKYKEAYTMDGQPTIMTYSGLSNNTEYYIYCYGLTVDGEVTTDFYKKKFETKMVDTVDLELTANISNITRYGALIEVEPSDNENSYFWTYVSEMDWVKYDLDFIMDNMIQNVMTAVAGGANIYDIIHIGPSSEDVKNLWAGTKYHLVGWGMDGMGTPTTQPKEFGEFTTLSDEYDSDCTFDIQALTVTDRDIQLHITPSDNSIRYYVGVVDVQKCVGYDDYQMAQRLINMEQNRFNESFYGEGVDWSNASWMLMGEQTKWARQDLAWTFSPNHTYRTFVFGVNANGTRNTDVACIETTTPAAAQSDMTIEIKLDDATYDYGTFTFVPSNQDEYYIPLLVETEEMQYVTNPDGTLNEMELCHEIEHYYDDTPNYYTLKGTKTQKFRWISDRDYTMLVCGWSGGNTTHFYRYDLHTPSIPFNEGKGDVNVEYELFDATELAKLDYDRWREYEGFVVMRLTLTPNADAANYYAGVWMPESTYEDVGGADYLLSLIQMPEVSIVNRPSAMYRTLSYGVTYSLSFIATDSEGKFGPWHYEEFTPLKGVNITAAYDFWSRPADAPAKVIAISPEGKVVDIKMPELKSREANVKADRLSSRNAAAPAVMTETTLGRN